MKGALFLAIFVPAVAIAAPDFNPGNYEITTVMQAEGMPFPIPPHTKTTCLTKENFIPNSEESNKDGCKQTKMDISGNLVNWEIHCDNSDGKSTISSQITYGGDNFSGEMNMLMQSDKGTFKIKHSINGQRTGDC